jgi:uncharacterized OB-fold protein
LSVSDEELVRTFPGYGLDRDNAGHYRGRLARKLLLSRCNACGFWRHPPKPVCPRCWSSDVRPTEVAGTGSIYLLIFLHQGPPAEGVDYSTPYPVATVELDEQAGLRFTGTVVGAPNEALAIGKRVKLDWVERGGVPTPVFCLTEESRA